VSALRGNGKQMSKSLSKSLRDRLTTLIGGFAVKKPCAAIAREEPRVGAAPVEAVARVLGYTEKELLLAADVLNRFAWQYPAEPPRKNANSTETETIDSLSSRNPAA
jgi:hypothetical protein